MSMPLGLVVCVALAAPPMMAGPVSSFSHAQFRPGQRFEIATRDQVLRGELLDPQTGECLAVLSGADQSFTPRQRLWLLGATRGYQPGAGGLSLILMHQVRIGMRMELGMGDLSRQQRVVTEPVTSITLLAPPVAAAEQTALR